MYRAGGLALMEGWPVRVGIRLSRLAVGLVALIVSCTGLSAFGAGKPAIDPDRVVFGYIQSEGMLEQVRWNALTHVAALFSGLSSTGSVNFTGFNSRHAALKAGGAAQAAGVKVIMCVQSFDDSTGGVIEQVMTNATKRQTLVTSIVNAIAADGYCAGVNFDFEFSWGSSSNTSIRDGIALFLQTLRSQLPATKEISFYVNASYNQYQWPGTALGTYCDYVLQSGYDYGSGRTAHAITDQNSNESALAGWFAGGVPPEKMVYTLSAYGRRWYNANTYNQTQPDNPKNVASQGFTDGLYNTTIRTSNGGPFATNYVTGDETMWYTYNNGTSNSITVNDTEQSLGYKMRSTLSFPATGSYAGRKMKGVGFWSLMWFAETGSVDPFSGTNSIGDNYTRTYPHIYQLSEEIFAPAGTSKYVFNKFEAQDPRWDGFTNADAANRRSADNLNVNYASTARAIAASPSGAGAPADSTNAMKLDFAFSASPGKLFFRHELLRSDLDTVVNDIHAADAKFSALNAINANVHVGGSGYSGVTVRLVVFDANRQLEASPAFPLTTAGWNTLTWDMTNTTAGNVTGLTTAEPAFLSGNGTLNTSVAGARDIGFVGFLVERSGGSASGTVYLDELSYEPRQPSGFAYQINEFRNSNSSQEFVEITGTTGAFPANLELRFYSAVDGSYTAVPLSGQTLPVDGKFVVGDTAVPNVDYVPAGWGAADNIARSGTARGNAGGIQLIDSASGAVYDSVTYRAMIGLGDLVRAETFGVTNEGSGWLGDTGTGTAEETFGRYPDGTDTNMNEGDFALLPPTPGTANGSTINEITGATFDFASVPSAAVAFKRSKRSEGCTASRYEHHKHRAGTYFGWWIPQAAGCRPTSEIQAWADLAVTMSKGRSGFLRQRTLHRLWPYRHCGRQGTSFFPTTLGGGNGYEDGYWLIYENGTVNLNDGQANHAGAFQFVLANNNNMQSTRTLALGTNKTLANLGSINPGTTGIWVPFRLSINPSASDVNGRLLAQINGVDVYRGSIPDGGPTSGAFQWGVVTGRNDNHKCSDGHMA